MEPTPQYTLTLLEDLETCFETDELQKANDATVTAQLEAYKNSVFIDASYVEILFKLTFSFSNLLPYYKAVESMAKDIVLREAVGLEVLRDTLLTVHTKMSALYQYEAEKIKYPFDNEGVIYGALRRLKGSIQEMHDDNRNPFVAHIPHAGVKIPSQFKDDYLLSKQEQEANIYEYADYKIDKLFGRFEAMFEIVKSDYSRLFFDPERFFDDTQESMQLKHGLGWFYENAIIEKKPLRTTKNKEAVAPYYSAHHHKLSTLVERKLQAFNTCTIIDCHSFSNKRYWFHDQEVELPDICIGFDTFHKDEELVTAILEEFKDYNVTINTPYAGSMVPTEYYMKDARVKSVMIEINKKLYLKSDNVSTSKNFNDIFYKLGNIGEKIQVAYKRPTG